MKSIVRFFRVTMLWIILLPLTVTFVGAASNQAVLIANGDKFPVLMNSQAIAKHSDSDGMIDSTHCVMTKQTHLNALADIFDFKEYTMSIGDMLLVVGEWLSSFCIFVWGSLIVRRVYVG